MIKRCLTDLNVGKIVFMEGSCNIEHRLCQSACRAFTPLHRRRWLQSSQLSCWMACFCVRFNFGVYIVTISEKIIKIAGDARQASLAMARLSTAVKNDMLLKMAAALEHATPGLIVENRTDLEAGRRKGLSVAMLDRLMLDEGRIRGIAEALREIAALPDPVGEVTRMWKRPNELMVGKMRIPLGTIGIIYESRPNVTADAA